VRSVLFCRLGELAKPGPLWPGDALGAVRIGIAEEGGAVTELFFEGHVPSGFARAQAEGRVRQAESALAKEAARQVGKYLAGELRDFSLPLDFRGTEFQAGAWKALLAIPYGETRSYKDMAEMVGRPKAFRAVGLANNRNPISIIAPCHRVIGSSGALVGYGGGLPMKRWLLSLEQGRLWA